MNLHCDCFRLFLSLPLEPPESSPLLVGDLLGLEGHLFIDLHGLFVIDVLGPVKQLLDVFSFLRFLSLELLLLLHFYNTLHVGVLEGFLYPLLLGEVQHIIHRECLQLLVLFLCVTLTRRRSQRILLVYFLLGIAVELL